VHAKLARPYLLAGIVCFVVDKGINALWTLVPVSTTVFRNRGETTAQVQFPKHYWSKKAGQYKIGQYVFVNFPELSLHEWHPFSVTSGPQEDFVELHIRALGDHTEKIVTLAKICAADGRLPMIRRDGPYGSLQFDYRRYGVLMLVAGGVGITPIIGMLKDIYGGHDQENSVVQPHRMECV
jgi:predicted ferric reductase